MRLRRIPVTTPRLFDWPWALGFLRARAAPSLEVAGEDAYARGFIIGDRPALLRFVRVGRQVVVETESRGPSDDQARAAARQLFHLDADAAAFGRHVAADRILGDLVRARPGIRLPQLPDPFEGIVRAVVGQQVSVAGARTMVERVVAAAGRPLTSGRTALRAFPTPDRLLVLGETRLRTLGLTRAKTATLLRVAEATRAGELDWDELRRAPAEEAVARMTAIKGIGSWTAAYVRMRALGDLDAFPASDLGVVQAMQHRLGRATPPVVVEIERLAEAWRPWRACGAVYLWHGLSLRPKETSR